MCFQLQCNCLTQWPSSGQTLFAIGSHCIQVQVEAAWPAVEGQLWVFIAIDRQAWRRGRSAPPPFFRLWSCVFSQFSPHRPPPPMKVGDLFFYKRIAPDDSGLDPPLPFLLLSYVTSLLFAYLLPSYISPCSTGSVCTSYLVRTSVTTVPSTSTTLIPFTSISISTNTLTATYGKPKGPFKKYLLRSKIYTSAPKKILSSWRHLPEPSGSF